MSNRFVVVTGASKGIGRATALHLDKQGFTVFAGIRNPADGEALKRDASPRLTPIVIDVTNAEQIEAALAQIKPIIAADGLAGLVNNAGVAVAAPIEFVPIDELRRQLEVNLVGQVAVTQAFLPCIRQARGRIINVSSIGGRIVSPGLGAYVASKFALEAISDTLRLELKPWGIEVVSIEPGAIATPMWESSTAFADRLFQKMPAQFHELYSGLIANVRKGAAEAEKRGIPPERVAEVIERALTANKPQTRYLVGTDARIAGHIIAHLPDRFKDRILASMG